MTSALSRVAFVDQISARPQDTETEDPETTVGSNTRTRRNRISINHRMSAAIVSAGHNGRRSL